MTEPRSVRHRRAHAAARANRRYPWVRSQQHMLSPQNDRWRAAAFPDQCGRVLLGMAQVEPGRPRPCLRCAHRHHGDDCASHVWGDTCGYDAGTDCPGPGLRPLRLRRSSAADGRRAALAVVDPEPFLPPLTPGPVTFAPYLGPWLPEHVCPVCGVERADYEGPGRHLDTCPNCGATESPIEAT